LSAPALMTTPVLFWVEGNSSIDFGLANHLQQFHFGQVKKNVTLFFLFSFKHVLQTYQPHFKSCNPSSSFLSCIHGGPNTIMSSVSKSIVHNSISNAITHSNVTSIAIVCSNVNSIMPSPLPMFPCTFYTQPPFVNFLKNNYFALCYKICQQVVHHRFPLHVAMVQKTIRSSCVVHHCFLCVAK